MPTEQLTVYIVDDDASIRDSLSLMLGLAGYRVSLFADAESFLAACQPDWAGCVVADLRMPGMTGIDLQAELKQRGSPLQFIIITAHGDVATARTAFQAQAIDFLEKPFDHTELIKAIETAFNAEQRRLDENRQSSADREKIAALTGREREVLQLAARGLHAKEIARDLGISPRTVEVHKARIMAKLGARNVAELVRLAVATGQDGN
ncbi:MAG: response regulator transcription factor [Burkholderiales bacterium]|jgi:RNA polymerase sigma factor (sigma-70 family)